MRFEGGSVDASKTVIFAPDFFASGTTTTVLRFVEESETLENDIVGLDLDGLVNAASSGLLQIDFRDTTDLTVSGEIDQNGEGLIWFLGTQDGVVDPPTNLVLNTDIMDVNRLRITGPMVGGTGSIDVASVGGSSLFGGLLELSNGTIIGPTHTLTIDGAILPHWPGNEPANPVVNAPVFVQTGGIVVGGQTAGPTARPLSFNAAVTFDGSTQIRSESAAGDNPRTHQFNDCVDVSTGTLTIFENQTVQGTGAVTIADGASLVNNGILELPIVAQGELDGGSGSEICSDVILETATASGSLDIAGTMTIRADGDSFIEAAASVDVEGTTTVEEGALVVEGSAALFGSGGIVAESTTALTVNGMVDKAIAIESGALLAGEGAIIGDVDVAGMLGPGNSAGTLDIDGCVVLDKGSVTIIEIGGTMPGMEHDQVNNGTAAMTVNVFIAGGILDIQLIENFYPRSQDLFVIIRGFNIQGNFDNVIDGRVDVGNGNSFAVELVPGEIPGSQDMVLRDFVPPLGDADGNGEVNLLDVQPFVEAISDGLFFDQLDINRDGAVNLLDVAGFIEILSGG